MIKKKESVEEEKETFEIVPECLLKTVLIDLWSIEK